MKRKKCGCTLTGKVCDKHFSIAVVLFGEKYICSISNAEIVELLLSRGLIKLSELEE